MRENVWRDCLSPYIIVALLTPQMTERCFWRS
nr:MAG TPA: hypothetical protein [Caudoviricetes sp.]